MATILDVHQAIVRRMPPEEQRIVEEIIQEEMWRLRRVARRQYVRCSMTAFGYEQTEPATSLSVSLPPSAEVDQRRISPARESRHPATAFGPIPGAFQCATL
jgi:hypothetical protein